MKKLTSLLLIISFSCTNSMNGRYIQEEENVFEITFYDEYCAFRLPWSYNSNSTFKVEEDMIFLSAEGIMGNVSFKILNDYAIEGQGMAEGIYIKEGYEKQYYKSLLGIYVITSTKLNVREGPGTSKKVLGSMKKGDRVDVIEIENKNWYKVMTGSGEGFVSSKYLEKEP